MKRPWPRSRSASATPPCAPPTWARPALPAPRPCPAIITIITITITIITIVNILLSLLLLLLFLLFCALSSLNYPKYDDGVCSKLFFPRSSTTSEVVVRRAFWLHFQQQVLEIQRQTLRETTSEETWGIVFLRVRVSFRAIISALSAAPATTADCNHCRL